MKFVMPALGVLTILLAAIAFFLLGWQTQSNCEATLIFAERMEAAIEASPNRTEEQKEQSREFFQDVYSRLNC